MFLCKKIQIELKKFYFPVKDSLNSLYNSHHEYTLCSPVPQCPEKGQQFSAFVYKLVQFSYLDLKGLDALVWYLH